jgi:hypothetical protein
MAENRDWKTSLSNLQFISFDIQYSVLDIGYSKLLFFCGFGCQPLLVDRLSVARLVSSTVFCLWSFIGSIDIGQTVLRHSLLTACPFRRF